MRPITFLQPNRLTFGRGCLDQCVEYIAHLGVSKLHIVSSPTLTDQLDALSSSLRGAGKSVTVDASVATEPTLTMFAEALQKAESAEADCVLGVGGGSALDMAKLIATFTRSQQRVEDAFGIGLVSGRSCHLICVPTTAGTGSEVSPNAILLDEAAKMKKGVVSPYLVPDAAFVDPLLTISMPPNVTAATGLDALTHCVEAYTNKFAHPLVDLYALRGIELCAEFLVRAVRNGHDLDARDGMALASLYGGLCLGPVNTAAVHALAYPLGGEFHVPHGLSNAILLPPVFRFNAVATPERHAAVARALGVRSSGDDLAVAIEGAARLQDLAEACGVFEALHTFHLEPVTIPAMATAAMAVTRLLRNNPRELTAADAEDIYRQSFAHQQDAS